MSMVADSKAVLATFEDLDCCSAEYFRNKVEREAFILGRNKSGQR